MPQRCPNQAHRSPSHTATNDLEQEGRNRAGELIEDFMIAANGVTARFLQANGLPTFRRIVRTPERWDTLGWTTESPRRK